MNMSDACVVVVCDVSHANDDDKLFNSDVVDVVKHLVGDTDSDCE